MNFIYYGTIFVLLSFSINLGGSQIELFPDAIGYFLILKGVQSLYPFQPNFKKLEPFLYFLLGFNALVFLNKLFMFIPDNGILFSVFGSISLVLFYFVFYRLFKDFNELKPQLKYPDEVDKLNRTWLRYMISGLVFFGVTILEVLYFVMSFGYTTLQTLMSYALYYTSSLESIVSELLIANQTVLYSIVIYILVAMILVIVILVYMFKVVYSLYKINTDFKNKL